MTTPFLGPTYDLLSRPASVQRTINMEAVPIEPGNERAGWVFKDVPGLTSFVPGAGSTTQLASAVLDPFQTGIWAAYSIQRLFTFYFGPLVRVAKSSNTATQLDIGYDANGNMDAAALSAFLGADTGYIVKLYDQTNNGHHSSPITGTGSTNTATATKFTFLGTNSGMITTAKSTARGSYTTFLKCTPTTLSGAEYFWILGESVVQSDNGAFLGHNTSRARLFGDIADDVSNALNYPDFGSADISAATSYTLACRLDRALSPAIKLYLSGTNQPITAYEAGGGPIGTIGTTFASRYWHLGGNSSAADMAMDVTTFLIYEESLSDADMVSIAALLP